MQHPRIRDVAGLAGVAPSTVSVVLNEVEGARVADDTRRRIREAAEVLGYVPNAIARGLRTGVQRTVALVNDEVTLLPYAAGLVQGLQEACWRLDATLVILTTGTDPAREREALEYASGQRHTGIVLASNYHADRAVPAVPGTVVLLNREPEGRPELPHVVPDDAGSARVAAGELLALGHERIGLLTVADTLEGNLRREGFVAELGEAGSPDPTAYVDASPAHDATAHGGWVAGGRLLDRLVPPTAIVCFNDRMAMGVYRAAAERGLRVPEDLSVVGHDNLEPLAESLHPSLTTVEQPHVQMGELAAEIALDPSHPARRDGAHRVQVAGALIERFSAAVAPSGARMRT